jgi:hypothetical protein
MNRASNPKEYWRQLCEAADREHDPDKLLELIHKIDEAFSKGYESRKPSRGIQPRSAQNKPRAA